MAVYKISEPTRMHDGKTNRLFAEYQCDCGRIFVMRCDASNKSSGCARGDGTRKRLTTHGASKTPTYVTWRGMLARCNVESHDSYANYGGRGISVCKRWSVFENFVADMGERPEGCSIDRIDSNGDYEPANCRWATNKQQRRNTRVNRMLSINDQTKTVVEWSECKGAANEGTIRYRLKSGWSDVDAVFGSRVRATLVIDGISKTVLEWSENPLAVESRLIHRRLGLGFPPVEAVFCERGGKWHS